MPVGLSDMSTARTESRLQIPAGGKNNVSVLYCMSVKLAIICRIRSFACCFHKTNLLTDDIAF